MILSIIHTVVDIFFVWFLIKHINEIERLQKIVHNIQQYKVLEKTYNCKTCGVCVYGKNIDDMEGYCHGCKPFIEINIDWSHERQKEHFNCKLCKKKTYVRNGEKYNYVCPNCHN